MCITASCFPFQYAAANDLRLDRQTVQFIAGSQQAIVTAVGIIDNIKECEESFQISASPNASSAAIQINIGVGTASIAVTDTTEGLNVFVYT